MAALTAENELYQQQLTALTAMQPQVARLAVELSGVRGDVDTLQKRVVSGVVIRPGGVAVSGSDTAPSDASTQRLEAALRAELVRLEGELQATAEQAKRTSESMLVARFLVYSGMLMIVLQRWRRGMPAAPPRCRPSHLQLRLTWCVVKFVCLLCILIVLQQEPRLLSMQSDVQDTRQSVCAIPAIIMPASHCVLV